MHSLRDIAHAQRLVMHSYGDVMSHNSRMEKPRTIKLSAGVDHVTHYRGSLSEVKRS